MVRSHVLSVESYSRQNHVLARILPSILFFPFVSYPCLYFPYTLNSVLENRHYKRHVCCRDYFPSSPCIFLVNCITHSPPPRAKNVTPSLSDKDCMSAVLIAYFCLKTRRPLGVNLGYPCMRLIVSCKIHNRIDTDHCALWYRLVSFLFDF